MINAFAGGKRHDPMENILCGDQWLSLVEGQHGDISVHYIRAKDEALIVPLTDDGEVLFTIEPAPALGQDVLILPGGEVETDEYSLDTANRELQEEIGFRADRLDYLTSLAPWSKYLTTQSHLFLARGLTPSQLNGDETYEISVYRHPLATFERLIADGNLFDARVIAALYLAHRFLLWEGQARDTD